MRTRKERRARHFITIRRDDSAAGSLNPDYTGNPVIRNAPAKYHETGGSSTFRGEQISEQIKCIFEMRKLTNQRIEPRMQVEFDSRTYPIESVTGTNVLLLMCREEQ